MQTKKKFTRYIFDLLLIAVLLILSLSVYFFAVKKNDTGRYACVYIGDEAVASYDLSVDGIYKLNGGSNILVIEDGMAYISYADCPDGWCKHQGKISLLSERIVCLPNRVMVTVEEAER